MEGVSIHSPNIPELQKLIPSRFARFLQERPTIIDESEEEFDALFADFIVEYDPQTLMDFILVKDLADVTWSLARMTNWLSAAIEVNLADAAVSLVGSEFMRAYGCNDTMARRELTYMVRHAAAGSKKQRELLDSWTKYAGVNTRMLQFQSFSLGVSSISELRDIIAKETRKRDQLMRKIDDRRKLFRNSRHGGHMTIDVNASNKPSGAR